MNGAAIGDLAGRSIEDFDIRPGDADATVAGLSGGNQQKVVVAREITRPGLSLLVCAQPTRGVDIGAIELIHRRIVAARDAGAAVLLVSAELSEIRSLSDRVAVLYRGRIAEVFDGAALAEGDALERLGQLMHWMTNIKDWCISRQLWWGHRIPAWHCGTCSHITVAREAPAACESCGATDLAQDDDVLDTWFSSALWPFSTLGWPEETRELKTFYPNSVLVTGPDIIFFWVARMHLAQGSIENPTFSMV